MQDLHSLAAVFQKRTADFESQNQTLLQKERIVGWARLFSFLLLLTLSYFILQNANYVIIGGLLLSLVLFIWLLRKHSVIKERRILLLNLKKLNEKAIQKLRLELYDEADGVIFEEAEHPYTKDLDIFGRFSLFALFNHSSFALTQSKLAGWLKNAASKEEISQRHKALEQLPFKLDYKQQVLASSANANWEKESWDKLSEWAAQKPNDLPSWLRVYSFVGPVLMSSLVLMWVLSLIPIYALIIGLIPHALLIRKLSAKINAASRATNKGLSNIKGVKKGIEYALEEHFTDEWMENRQKMLKQSVSGLSGLSALAYALQNRSNLLYGLFNYILLLDLHQVKKMERWKTEHGADLQKWLDTYAELECLFSLSLIWDYFPYWNLPELKEEGITWKGENLGHPLLKPEERITNHFALKDRGSIALITGSNMAGKSTFLRTIGINTVLALAGAPVCASQLIISPFRVFTGMRVGDDLQAKTSSFFAELKRIKELLFLAGNEKEPCVLFLLDEILKGTNSADRHAGARGLIKQLNGLNSLGLVSTHDLELIDLEEQVPLLSNYSFHSTVKNGELSFDYKIKNGPCPSFNAQDLMRMMGISLEK